MDPISDVSAALILIVDDERDMRRMLRLILEGAGYDVLEASNGEQAVEVARAAQPDVIILDVMMPYMDGFEVARKVRQLPTLPWTPILMLTGLGGVAKTVEGLEAGADDFLGKPYNRAELMARVSALLRLKKLHRQMEARADMLERERAALQENNLTLHQALRRYLSKEIADIVLGNPTRNLELGGAAYDLTVLYVGIQGFGPFNTARSPYDVLQTLNRIWDQLVPLVFEGHGTFDRFAGEALVAFYGAPISLGDDALRAVQTALAMQYRFATLREAAPELADLSLGIGIYTGEAVVGNVGSEQIMDYTVVGYPPGAAERLQELARPGQILIGPATYEAVQDAVLARPLTPTRLRGTSSLVDLYEVAAPRNYDSPNPDATQPMEQRPSSALLLRRLRAAAPPQPEK